jgi:hypothetical protein
LRRPPIAPNQTNPPQKLSALIEFEKANLPSNLQFHISNLQFLPPSAVRFAWSRPAFPIQGNSSHFSP